LFKKDADFAAFEQVLVEALERVPLRILGYTVMGNHWHFVVWPRQRQHQQVTGRNKGDGDHFLTAATERDTLNAMPRRARSIVGGYAYHVLNRANGRLRLFKKDADFAAFERNKGDGDHFLTAATERDKATKRGHWATKKGTLWLCRKPRRTQES
jgi:REP element-mobilizing transposase RayT